MDDDLPCHVGASQMNLTVAPTPLSSAIVLHIPRTGGTTLRSVLSEVYGKKRVISFPDFPEPEQINQILARVQLKRSRKVSKTPNNPLKEAYIGHVNYGIHQYLDEPHIPYITLLRDPVERAISLYFHKMERSQQIHPENPAHTQGYTPIADYFESRLNGQRANVANQQTTMIAGLAQRKGPSLNESMLSDSALFDRAVENIESSFVLVGITEMWDEFLLLASEILGWPEVHYVRQNAIKNRLHRSDYTAEMLDRLERANAVDIRLYNYAKERLRHEVKVRGPEFAQRRQRYLQEQKQYEEVHGKSKGDRFVR